MTTAPAAGQRWTEVETVTDKKRESDCGEARVNRMEQEDWQRLKEEMTE